MKTTTLEQNMAKQDLHPLYVKLAYYENQLQNLRLSHHKVSSKIDALKQKQVAIEDDAQRVLEEIELIHKALF